MPKIFEYFGLIFFIYTEDHLPIHVHVKYAEYESKFEEAYIPDCTSQMCSQVTNYIQMNKAR